MHTVSLHVAGACFRRAQLIGAASCLSGPSFNATSFGTACVRFQSTNGSNDASPSASRNTNKGGVNTTAAHDTTTAPHTPEETASSAQETNTSAAASPGSTDKSAAHPAAAESTSAPASSSSSPSSSAPEGMSSSSFSNSVSTSGAADAKAGAVTTPEPEPVRWVQPTYQDPDTLPIVDEKGEYIVSRVQWPTGEIAYRTPAPVDDKLAPRFGYNVVQVRKHVSWWKYNQKYPRLSLAYINIQVLFLLGLAWLVAFLTTEYRNATEALRTPGAMVGEHRGKGPATNQTQKVTFEKDEMTALMDKAQNNWYDGKAEASYVGSKEYKMKKIPRPKEFSADDFRKR